MIRKTLIKEWWDEETASQEWTFHQLSPYVGKLKSSLAKSIIRTFTEKGQVIFDPFCGAGTVPLEAWTQGRIAIANDLNPYAYTITNAKLFPPKSLESALKKIDLYQILVNAKLNAIDLRKIPKWVRSFFHPETLRETLCWVDILQENREFFLLSCLLGILHHQRPGFLSFPSSHAVPYLRSKKFPKEIFPQLYEYRSVNDRLKKKVTRSFKRLPELDYTIRRKCTQKDSKEIIKIKGVDAIITSPPYMRQLEYARDNRLRLWFLGCEDWKALDSRISPSENSFIDMIKSNLENWKDMLNENGKCIFILGDSLCRSYGLKLPETISHIAINEIGGYKLLLKVENQIPEKKRVRKHLKGSIFETILVLQKTYDDK
jgi:DNA modification methylase